MKINIIHSDEYWAKLQEMLSYNSIDKTLEYIGILYVTPTQAKDMLGYKTLNSIQSLVKNGIKDKAGRRIKLVKHYPYKNNKGMYLIKDVLKIRKLKHLVDKNIIQL